MTAFFASLSTTFSIVCAAPPPCARVVTTFLGQEYFHKPESEFHYILNNLETHNKGQRGCLRQPASDSDNCTDVCADSNSKSQPHLDQVHLGIHFVGSVESNVNSVHFVQTQLHQQERSVRKILPAGTSFKDNLRISNEGQKVPKAQFLKSLYHTKHPQLQLPPTSRRMHYPYRWQVCTYCFDPRLSSKNFCLITGRHSIHILQLQVKEESAPSSLVQAVV